MRTKLRLGVNIDHVATIRNARGGRHPDPIRAASIAAQAGADGITAHLREDRRHISDDDITRLSHEIDLPLNLEMAATPEMLDIALRHRPHAVCLVPEKRQELTTEGGLDVAGAAGAVAEFVAALTAAGIRVALFIDPDKIQIEAARAAEAPVVELHTGSYCDASDDTGDHGDDHARGLSRDDEIRRLQIAALAADALGLEVHAGHGLSFATVAPVAAIPCIRELNIGHFLVGEAIFGGLDSAIRRMRVLMDRARAEARGQRSA